jgi:hypothetical protein
MNVRSAADCSRIADCIMICFGGWWQCSSRKGMMRACECVDVSTSRLPVQSFCCLLSHFLVSEKPLGAKKSESFRRILTRDHGVLESDLISFLNIE